MDSVAHFDVVVVGGGGGLTAAYHAEKDGLSVALVEAQPEALGGTCTNRGCLPTKGLIQSAKVLNTIRQAEDHGILLDQESVRADFEGIMEGVRSTRGRRADGVRKWVESSFTPFYGRARFVAPKVLEMEDGRRLTGDHIFLATGARPAAPPVPGLEDVPYWTNESVLELTHQPESLLVLGGGYIGCELAHFFEALGTEVTIADQAEHLLREDEDISELFTREFGRSVNLVLGAKVLRASQEDGRTVLEVDQQGETRTLRGDNLLVAAGRSPNTESLELHRTDVEVTERGWVQVDEELRTTHPDIFAYGDVIGQEMFKHTSSYEGELAYRNARGAGRAVSYRTNPHAVFSDPEIGSVGLTEAECRAQGLSYRTAKVDYRKFAKGEIVGSPPGLAKVIVEEDTDRILGFHMAGPHSADLIHEVVVAMNAGEGTAAQVRDTVHVHPTLPELIHKVFTSV